MGNRKQPTPVPDDAVKPPPPPAPPPKRDGEHTRDQIAKDYALALTIIDRLRTSHAALLAALHRIEDGADACECLHEDDNCCARQADVCCPLCIAAVAIAKAEGHR
jgi:hypothetical protein